MCQDDTDFKLFTKENALEQEAKIAIKKKRLKSEGEKKIGKLSDKRTIENGEIVIENKDEISDLFGDIEQKDLTLSDGNPLPTRFGKISDKFLNKQIEELGNRAIAVYSSF